MLSSMEEPLPTFFAFDPLSVMAYPDDFPEIDRLLDEPTTKTLTQSYLSSINWELKGKAIRRLEQHGVTPEEIATFLGMAPSHLARSFINRKVPWEYLFVGWKLAGLAPDLLSFHPTPAESVWALTRAVAKYHHENETLGWSHSSAWRESTITLTLADGALVHSLIENDHDRRQWIWLAVPFAFDFDAAGRSPEFVQFVSDIYTKAMVLVGHDPSTVELLTSWSPKSAPMSTALGHIALGWNPFQTHWRVANSGLSPLFTPHFED